MLLTSRFLSLSSPSLSRSPKFSLSWQFVNRRHLFSSIRDKFDFDYNEEQASVNWATSAACHQNSSKAIKKTVEELQDRLSLVSLRQPRLVVGHLGSAHYKRSHDFIELVNSKIKPEVFIGCTTSTGVINPHQEMLDNLEDNITALSLTSVGLPPSAKLFPFHFSPSIFGATDGSVPQTAIDEYNHLCSLYETQDPKTRDIFPMTILIYGAHESDQDLLKQLDELFPLAPKVGVVSGKHPTSLSHDSACFIQGDSHSTGFSAVAISNARLRYLLSQGATILPGKLIDFPLMQITKLSADKSTIIEADGLPIFDRFSQLYLSDIFSHFRQDTNIGDFTVNDDGKDDKFDPSSTHERQEIFSSFSESLLFQRTIFDHSNLMFGIHRSSFDPDRKVLTDSKYNMENSMHFDLHHIFKLISPQSPTTTDKTKSAVVREPSDHEKPGISFRPGTTFEIGQKVSVFLQSPESSMQDLQRLFREGSINHFFPPPSNSGCLVYMSTDRTSKYHGTKDREIDFIRQVLGSCGNISLGGCYSFQEIFPSSALTLRIPHSTRSSFINTMAFWFE